MDMKIDIEEKGGVLRIKKEKKNCGGNERNATTTPTSIATNQARKIGR